MLDNALNLLKIIESYGYKAYIVGGFVRDYILKIESNDIDICTNATPKELIEIFPDSYLPTNDYGSVTVMSKNVRFEITTFRKEVNYIDHRRPSEVKYIDSLYDDLLRRDFTINTICMNSNGEIIDYLGGCDDINSGVIRCVGDPLNKFEEDSLRILRAVRFSTVLDFKLDSEVEKAIQSTKYLLRDLSYYRKKEELDKIFSCKNSKNGVQLILKYNLDDVLELRNLKNISYTSNLIGMWSLLDVSDKYPFTNNEKDLFKSVREALNCNIMDPFVLYKYGLYVSSVVCDIKNIDKKDITREYNNLVIHSRGELDITSKDIIKIFDGKAGSYLKDIYIDIEKKVLYREIPNINSNLVEYIKNNYK